MNIGPVQHVNPTRDVVVVSHEKPPNVNDAGSQVVKLLLQICLSLWRKSFD